MLFKSAEESSMIVSRILSRILVEIRSGKRSIEKKRGKQAL
ncbi:MAG: hypothetical protein QXO47_09575 [Thermoproteota archaeon]